MVTIHLEDVPLCSEAGHIKVVGDIDANQHCHSTVLDKQGDPLKCFKFNISRNSSLIVSSFHMNVGNGNSCNGELDYSSYAVNGTCNTLSEGGAQTTNQFSMPVGVSEMAFYLCINDNAKVSVCDLCIDCTPNASCKLDSTVTAPDCSIPGAFTDPADDFSEINDCYGGASMDYSQSGSATKCDGGTISRTYTYHTWNSVDQAYTHNFTCSQTIKVPAAPVSHLNAIPNDTTVDCGYTPAKTIVLYTNNASGSCAISGESTYSITGSADKCNGGSFTESWTYTDICGTSATKSRIIKVRATPKANFTDPIPGNISIECGSGTIMTSSLHFSNGKTGDCGINGDITSTLTGNTTTCGNVTEKWILVNPCDISDTLTVSRTITITDTKKPKITCGTPKSIKCNDPLIFDTPAATDDCDQSLTITSTDSVRVGNVYTKTWTASDDCGNSASCSQSITRPDCSFGVFHTGTTCCDFKSQTPTIPLYQIYYSLNSAGAKLGVVTPGVFFYYTYITPPSTMNSPTSTFTFNIGQSNGGGLRNFSIQENNQIIVYDPTCGKINAVISNNTTTPGVATVKITGNYGGKQLVLSVKYDAKSLESTAYSGLAGTSCTYTFSNTAGGTSGTVNLVKGCVAAPAPTLASCTLPSSFFSNLPNTVVSEDKAFSIYPNPVTNQLNISGKSEISSIELISIDGKLVRKLVSIHATDAHMNTAGLSNGLYQIRITDRDGNQSIDKLIKQ